MSEDKQHIDAGALFWGLTLILTGTAFMLDRLGITDLHHAIEDYWPLVIICLGVSKLLRRRSVWPGLWLIAIGTWLQVVKLHLFDLTFRSSWPLLLIVLGAGIVMRSLFQAAPRQAAAREDRHE